MKFELPKAFLERINEQLKDEYQDFLDSYNEKGRRGIRINKLKTTAQEIIKQAPFHMEPVPWVENGFFVDEKDDPAGSPFYRAGLYYIQEPSAMTPADRLEIIPGDRVLDLCAAPGGKATALAAKLEGKGILVANDASKSRCRALLHNLELFGADNIIVTNELPGTLSEVFPEYFDKILVDAPCSGEGMFRKEPEVIGTWTPSRVEHFAAVQRDIIDNAVSMLKPGGMMLYSTCTFSKDENEGSISYLLEKHPEMSLCDMKWYDGFESGNPDWGNNNEELSKTVRIWPHKMEGAGHYLALLKKDSNGNQAETKKSKKSKKKTKANSYNQSFNKEERQIMDDFFSDFDGEIDRSSFENRQGKVYYMPFGVEEVPRLRFIRCGLYMGELKKKRFEASQALALWYRASEFKNHIDLNVDDERIRAYLNGENISLTDDEQKIPNGPIFVRISGYPVGFAKKINNILKNKYLWLK